MKQSIRLTMIGLELFMLSSGCVGGGNGDQWKDSRLPFDQDVGRSEVYILQHMGAPTYKYTAPARKMGGELRSVLRTMVATENTVIKELYYRTDKGERIFWLTRHGNDEWKVISDVEIPPGVEF